VGGRGRDDIGLAARLKAHLVVDAVAQREAERHRERDDRQQQHVGQRQQQADSQSYGAISSGALKRNPTPRTVWR
jgi:hypothetical protein